MWPHNPWATNHNGIPPISLDSKQERSPCCIVKSCVGPAFILEADVKLERQERTYFFTHHWAVQHKKSITSTIPCRTKRCGKKKECLKKKNKNQLVKIFITRDFPRFEPWFVCLGRGEKQKWAFRKIEWANIAVGFMDPCNRSLS